MGISIIVGLGNPGDNYAATRHNVGFWLLDRLAADAGATLKSEKKVMGDVAQTAIANNNVRLLRPATYMNESGQSVRRMLDFCGLEFEEACMNFHETERNVRTPSSEQVRQPIFDTAIEQWKQFEPWLSPLKQALGPELAPDS